MNPEKVRCQIIEYTKHEMYLHGADGLTMDDIAKGMKMSKRTLYKLFPSKTCLFRICLYDFTNGIRSRLKQSQMRMDSSCMQVLFATVNGYLRTDALQNLWLPASGSRSGSLCGRFAGGYLSELPARYSVCCSADAEPYSLTRAF